MMMILVGVNDRRNGKHSFLLMLLANANVPSMALCLVIMLSRVHITPFGVVLDFSNQSQQRPNYLMVLKINLQDFPVV